MPAPVANEQIRVVVQVVDRAGNVAVASSKGPGFGPGATTAAGPVNRRRRRRRRRRAGSRHRRRYAVAGAAGATFTVSIDGSAPQPYGGPFVPTLTDGTHVIDVSSSDGTTASVTVRLDTTAPTVQADVSPPANANGWRNVPVTANFRCGDATSGVGDLPATGIDRRG